MRTDSTPGRRLRATSIGLCEPYSGGKHPSPCPFIDIVIRNRDQFMLLGRNSTPGDKREAIVALPDAIKLGLPYVLKRVGSMIKNKHFFALCWRRY
jgi:hypothetical protein